MSDETVTIKLTGDGGELVDGTLDNAFVVASQNGQAKREAACSRIRNAFWDQDSQRTGDYTLSPSDWRLVTRELREPVGDPELERDLSQLADTIEDALSR